MERNVDISVVAILILEGECQSDVGTCGLAEDEHSPRDVVAAHNWHILQRAVHPLLWKIYAICTTVDCDSDVGRYGLIDTD